jgi:hypothetical protein
MRKGGKNEMSRQEFRNLQEVVHSIRFADLVAPCLGDTWRTNRMGSATMLGKE